MTLSLLELLVAAKNGKWKRMMFRVATNVVASRPPERRPTGTPHARANFRLLVHPLLIDFGEGSCSSSCCDREKTKSIPNPRLKSGLWNGV